MATRFHQLYAARVAAGKYACVGLDPNYSKIPDCVQGATPAERVETFVKALVNATHEYAAAFKLQSAYYEALGPDGLAAMQRIIQYIRQLDATIPVILDYKRADIDRTNEGYTDAAFKHYDVDAVTVHPYLGMEAMKPFLDCEDKLIIVLCRTSNEGAGEFQDLICQVFRHKGDGMCYSTLAEAARERGLSTEGASTDDFDRQHMRLYLFAAHRVAQSWNKHGNCAVVVGATWSRELELVREIVGDMPILVPGIGAQGGKLSMALEAGGDSKGWGVILNNSSDIDFAYLKLTKEDSEELKYPPEQHAEASAEAARTMNEAIAQLMAA